MASDVDMVPSWSRGSPHKGKPLPCLKEEVGDGAIQVLFWRTLCSYCAEASRLQCGQQEATGGRPRRGSGDATGVGAGSKDGRAAGKGTIRSTSEETPAVDAAGQADRFDSESSGGREEELKEGSKF